MLLTTAIQHIPDAFAADQAPPPPPADDTDSLIRDELSDADKNPEAAPAPEYPYPDADEPGTARARVSQAPASPQVELPQHPLPTTERPVRIDEDGQYFYDTKDVSGKGTTPPGVEAPAKVETSGQYKYHQDNKNATFSGRPGVEKPVSTTPSGEFDYAVEKTISNRSFSFRGGPYNPPGLKNSDTGETFQDIYPTKNIPMFLFDYEWKISKKNGELGLKLASGFFTTQGHGVFLYKVADRRPDDVPIEMYSFLLFPNTASAVYKFKYKEDQAFVPWVEGGAGFFTFAELRNDGVTPKSGGAAVLVAAGGVDFLLDKVDPKGLRQLDLDWGVSHTWFTVEYRQYIGLNAKYDFTSGIINGGFLVDF
jgi:hypothetical protein